MTFIPFFIFIEKELEPIDFKCKDCNHSYNNHMKNDNPTTQCLGKTFGVCRCKGFTINQKEIDDINDKLDSFRNILFKNLESAKQIMQLQKSPLQTSLDKEVNP